MGRRTTSHRKQHTSEEHTMKIAMIGLGKMGANMTQRLVEHGHQVVAFDLSAPARDAAAALGAEPAATLEEVASKLDSPKVAWVMVPAGEATNSTITTLAGLFGPGDVIIDGGNSNYKETAPLVVSLAADGIALVDAGTSGGIWGLKEGYCLMVGGTKEAVAVAEPVFTALAPEGGYAHVGPPGAGHFVKMVHNGIEYGLMQAYAEGFEIMSEAPEFDLDLHEIAAIWRYGSVVRSWLLELAERALRPESGFDRIEGVVADSGEGRWTVEEAIDRGVSAPVISSALFARFASQKTDAYGLRLVSALRNQFGGHAFVTADGKPSGETFTPK
ncbi:MAG: phosphogluconate dehydrogenase (NAD(+)-dependent, decarboxylating) [Acidimicrobiales bacterium]